MTSISNFGWFLGETDFGTNFVHLAILKNSDMTSISNFGWFLGETDYGTNFVHLAILKKFDMTSISNFGWFLGETFFGTNFVHLAILKNSDMTGTSNLGWFLGGNFFWDKFCAFGYFHRRPTKVETTGATFYYETLVSRLFETFFDFETKKQVVPWHQWHHTVWRHWK